MSELSDFIEKRIGKATYGYDMGVVLTSLSDSLPEIREKSKISWLDVVRKRQSFRQVHYFSDKIILSLVTPENDSLKETDRQVNAIYQTIRKVLLPEDIAIGINNQSSFGLSVNLTSRDVTLGSITSTQEVIKRLIDSYELGIFSSAEIRVVPLYNNRLIEPRNPQNHLGALLNPDDQVNLNVAIPLSSDHKRLSERGILIGRCCRGKYDGVILPKNFSR